MGWLRFVGSSKRKVSFAKEPYKRDYILQKSPVILISLLIVATPYECMYVYIPICTSVYICTYRYQGRRTAYVCASVYVCVHTQALLPQHMYIYVQTYVHAHTGTKVVKQSIYIHTNCVYAHTSVAKQSIHELRSPSSLYMYMCMYAHTHACTHVLRSPNSL